MTVVANKREPRLIFLTSKPRMTDLRKKIEAIMSAITFAEEGEFEMAKSFMKTRQRVLLATRNNRLDRKTCTYAVNTCKRLGIGLDLLVVGDREDEELLPLMKPFLEQLESENISFTLTQKTGCFKQAILEFNEADNDVLFVVIESQGTLDSNCAMKDRRLKESWRRLKCPLVVVADGLKA